MPIAGHFGRWKLRAAHLVRSIVLAAFSVSIAFFITYPLKQAITYPFNFPFFGAVMVSAWMGGIAAGLLAILFSVLLINYFILPPLFTFAVSDNEQLYLIAFVLCALAAVFVIVSRRRTEQLIRTANDRLESMVQERTAELERSNHEIRERERHLRELTEAIPQQIWRATPNGEIEYVNAHLRGYLGGEACASLAGLLEKALHPDDRQIFEEAWQSAFAAGERFEEEARVRGGDGVYRWFLIRGNPQRSADGVIACWYGIHIAIEKQRRAQQSLLVAQEELLRLSKNLTMAEMAASIAHELNQPLTAVVTHAYACREWLRAKTLNLDKAADTAEKIVQESTRASNVVRRVRALFQKEATAVQPADLNHLIEELARLLRDEAIRRGVSIRLQLTEELPTLEMDAVLMQQVLLNLATNAMEAMSQSVREREVLICTSRHQDGMVSVAVSDRGPGVPVELHDKIFEAFFSTKPSGTGMGLAICRSIIEAHGGHLSVANLPEGGASFQFTLRAL